MMEMRSQPGVQYTTIIMGDTNICPLTERLVPVKKYTEESMEIFNANNKTAPLPVTTDMMSQYNGDLTSRQAGSIGGQMVKKMCPVHTSSFARECRTAFGHCVSVQYIAGWI